MNSPARRIFGIDRLKNHGLIDRLKGYAWMMAAVVIWASWLVLTSSGVTTDLSPIDLAGLRALVPAIVLGPLLWRHRSLLFVPISGTVARN